MFHFQGDVKNMFFFLHNAKWVFHFQTTSCWNKKNTCPQIRTNNCLLSNMIQQAAVPKFERLRSSCSSLLLSFQQTSLFSWHKASRFCFREKSTLLGLKRCAFLDVFIKPYPSTCMLKTVALQSQQQRLLTNSKSSEQAVILCFFASEQQCLNFIVNTVEVLQTRESLPLFQEAPHVCPLSFSFRRGFFFQMQPEQLEFAQFYYMFAIFF